MRSAIITIGTVSLAVAEAVLFYNIGQGKTGRELATLPPWKTVGILALWAAGAWFVSGLITDALRMIVD